MTNIRMVYNRFRPHKAKDNKQDQRAQLGSSLMQELGTRGCGAAGYRHACKGAYDNVEAEPGNAEAECDA